MKLVRWINNKACYVILCTGCFISLVYTLNFHKKICEGAIPFFLTFPTPVLLGDSLHVVILWKNSFCSFCTKFNFAPLILWKLLFRGSSRRRLLETFMEMMGVLLKSEVLWWIPTVKSHETWISSPYDGYWGNWTLIFRFSQVDTQILFSLSKTWKRSSDH